MKPYTPNTPGIFKMPMADYQAAPGVSKHSLDYVAKSPLDYALYRQYGMEPTEAMERSTLCHTACLEPELFESSYYLRPGLYPSTDKKGVTEMKKFTAQSNWCSAWLEAHKDKPVVTQTELAKIRNAARSVREDPTAGEFFDGKERCEMSLFARCPETGMMRKGRPDLMNTDGNETGWILDTKFVLDATERAFKRQFQDLRYYVQHAYYVDLVELLTGVKPRFLFVAVEKEPMHEKSEIHRVCCYELHEVCVELGRRHYMRDLRRFWECSESGTWPSDNDQIKPLELDKWLMREGAI